MISEVAGAPEDAEMIFGDLRRRLKREWAPHEFDALIEEAATRLGEKINARAFRERRIADWRRYLASLPDDADCSREMERVIDGEVANHFRSILPVSIRELVENLGLTPGPIVKRAVDILRQLHEGGVRDKQELLAQVATILRSEDKQSGCAEGSTQQ
jgi:hypothetical protein